MNKLTFNIFIFIIFIFSFQNVFAYSVETHTFLTDKVIDFYNKHFPNQILSDELKPFLIEGSRQEDNIPRWMNHFYDPIKDRGLTRDPAIDPLYNFGTWQKSKDWVKDDVNQNNLVYKVPTAIASILTAIQKRKISALTAETEFTWQKAINLYVQGEQEKAMFTLGHVLHLIEDVSVPDHTRNDPHVRGSPYEIFASKFNLNSPDNKLNIRLVNKTPVSFPNLEFYFEKLAIYSNNNFYSKDTIDIYELPNSIERRFDLERQVWFKVLHDSEFGDYRLVHEINPGRFNYAVSNKYNLSLLDPDSLVLSDYWSILSTKAVQYGAGVIDLFFKEAEKAKQNQPLVEQNKRSLLGQIIDFVQQLFTPASQENIQKPVIQEPLSEETVVEESAVGNEEDLAGLQNQLSDLIRQADALRNQIQAQNIVNQTNNQLAVASVSSAPSGSGGGGGGSGVSVFSAPSAPAANQSGDASPEPPQQNEQQEQSEAPPSPPSIPLANHIVISEILFDAVGGDAGKEFIELYNPTTTSTNLKDWSLKYFQEDSTSSVSLASFTRGSDRTSIPANGFLLVGLNNYDSDNYSGRTADIRRSNSLPNGGALDNLLKITVKLFDSEDNEIDSLVYDADSITTEGQSLERRAWQNGECLIPQQIGEFLGHGCDRDADDFNIRENPLPQNSENLPEPRNAPAQPEFLLTQLTTSTLTFDFEWRVQEFDFPSVYQLFLESATSSQLIYQTSSTNYSYPIEEWNRDYDFSLQAVDNEGLSSASTTAVMSAPDWFLPVQTEINSGSQASWYSDNWYQLGSGFYGTLLAITLEGSANRNFNYASLTLKEFLDSNYGQLHQSFVISSNAPFSTANQRITIRGLNIPLQPNKYYRLDTYLEIQNGSVILNGTNATGTAMYNGFIYGRGRVETQYSFYPYLTMVMQKNEPPLASPTPPEILSSAFDEFNRVLRMDWASSADPDTSDDLISYQFNFATSGKLLADNWQSIGRNLTANIPIDYSGGDTEYLIGVRAIDDFNNVSSSSVMNWRLPDDFVAPILSNFNNSAYQDFILSETGQMSSLRIFINDFTTDSFNPNTNECFVEFYEVLASSTDYLTRSAETYAGGGCAGRLNFSFADATLEAGRTYRWLFKFNSFHGAVKFWGDSRDLAQGLFSDVSVTNAKFKIISADNVVLFNNLFGQYP